MSDHELSDEMRRWRYPTPERVSELADRVRDLETRLAEAERLASTPFAKACRDGVVLYFKDGKGPQNGFIPSLPCPGWEWREYVPRRTLAAAQSLCDQAQSRASLAEADANRWEQLALEAEERLAELAAWRAVAEHCYPEGGHLQWAGGKIRVSYGLGSTDMYNSITDLADALGLEWRQ